jgi:hypothetical protein
MSSRYYEPQDHIQHLEVAPKAETLLDQREITIQSYQTTIPFDFDALDAGIESAWLTPKVRFGVFSRPASKGTEAITVVLGLQGEMAIRAYDYDHRRPLWYSWQDAIVDTVNIHYFIDEDGLLRFTATGGGRRISDELLHEFNSTFLGIPRTAVDKRSFDLDKLRDMCFKRFIKRLYLIRFSDPSSDEYRSIDHAVFQSRNYIDPLAERLDEIRADPKVRIDYFESDVQAASPDLASAVRVRFFIRGSSGSLRLRFPKLDYRAEMNTPEEQAQVAYRIVDAVVSHILDDDYYTHEPRLLEDLDTDVGLYRELVDLTQFRQALISGKEREKFFAGIDMNAPWSQWLPHLRALDELIQSDPVEKHVTELIGELAQRTPGMAARMLAACQEDPHVCRLDRMAANALVDQVQSVAAEQRAHVEGVLLAWALEHEDDSWCVDLEDGLICVLGKLTWRIEDLSLDALVEVVEKLIRVLHARLADGARDTGSLIGQLHWCFTVARAIPANHSGLPKGMALVAADKVPRTVSQARKVLKDPVTDLRAMDMALQEQFGLPAWPWFAAVRHNETVALTNSGIGPAHALRVTPAGMLFGGDGGTTPADIVSGGSVSLAFPGNTAALDILFEKFGRQYRVSVPIQEESAECTQTSMETIGAAVKQIANATALIPVAVAKIGTDLETVKQHVRGVPVLQADLKDARVVPEALALEIQNRIADILTVEQQEIWRAMRNAGGVQTEALPVLKNKGVVNSAATLTRRVKEIDEILKENGLPSCKTAGPVARYRQTGGYETLEGGVVPEQISVVEHDWAKDPAERETTIKSYLAASPEDQAVFRQSKPGIDDEARLYRKGEK